MTDEEARAWFAARFGAGAVERVGEFLSLVLDENGRQNLVAPSTLASIWSRHALDSAQLLAWDRPGTWLDIGTGGGFPGMVVGLLRTDPVVLVEPRRRRAEFLAACARHLGAEHVTVICNDVAKVRLICDIVSARAVASVEKLVRIAAHCVNGSTRWLLPRGRTLDAESRSIIEQRFDMFHVEQSLSENGSIILILQGLRGS